MLHVCCQLHDFWVFAPSFFVMFALFFLLLPAEAQICSFKVQFFSFFFCCSNFWCPVCETMAWSRTWRFTTVSSLEGFRVPALKFRSLIYLNSLFSCCMLSRWPQAICWEGDSLFHWTVLPPCRKLGDHRYLVSFKTLTCVLWFCPSLCWYHTLLITVIL